MKTFIKLYEIYSSIKEADFAINHIFSD